MALLSEGKRFRSHNLHSGRVLTNNISKLPENAIHLVEAAPCSLPAFYKLVNEYALVFISLRLGYQGHHPETRRDKSLSKSFTILSWPDIG